jgi:nitroreductase
VPRTSVDLPNRDGELSELHPLLAARFSPRAWAETDVTDDDLLGVLEAARWAPSWGNSQPWRYVVARRGTPAHDRIAATLSRGNASWAPRAPVLLVGAAKLTKDDGTDAAHAVHDLGQASAHLTFEAAARGLQVHQMAGFDADALHAALGFPDGVRPITLLALGHPGDPDDLDERLREKELRVRDRRPLGEVVFDGTWGVPFG